MKRQRRKLLLFGILFVLMAGACAAPTPGPLDQVKTFQDAFNKRDTEGFLALFADNLYWGDLGLGATSKKAVRNVLEFWFEKNSQIELSDCRLENDLVSCKLLFRDDCTPPEIGDNYHDMEFRIKDGKFFMISGPPTSTEQNIAFSNYLSQAMTWASQSLPEDFARVTDAEWTKFSETGDQGSGKLSAREFGQVYHRICTRYAEAK